MLREYSKFKSTDGCIGINITNLDPVFPIYCDAVMLILKDGETYYCPYCNFNGFEVEVMKGAGGCPKCDGAFYWKLRVFSKQIRPANELGRKIVLEDEKCI